MTRDIIKVHNNQYALCINMQYVIIVYEYKYKKTNYRYEITNTYKNEIDTIVV